MKVLLTGSGGMLAEDLRPVFKAKGHDVIVVRKDAVDITHKMAVDLAVRAAAPDVLINCAAYTKVDRAEDDEALAMKVNGEAPGILAETCRKAGVKLVHYSTDFVFDGSKSTPYTEEDVVNPISVYGKSKLEGERRIIASGCEYLIIRTAWLFGHTGVNFPKRIVTLAGERDELNIVYDQTGTPTYTVDLAEATLNLLGKKASGIFNFTNDGIASWYDFAYLTLELERNKGRALKLNRVNPILTAGYKTPAARPPYSVLDKAKYRNITGAAIPHWTDALKRFVDREWEGK
ncbi:MAG: dTDP-4-dehydrorhamnose reductase [Deltaproteobacteria bacterium]|nr:dTDP-4-dehydrorhamnose reductase [Deltaproteobacteria bacterium]